MQKVRHHLIKALAAYRNAGSGSISLVIDILFQISFTVLCAIAVLQYFA